jgi:hypothetical protein
MGNHRSSRPVGQTGSGAVTGNRARLFIESRRIANLKPNPKNPRRHPDRQIKLLMTNLAELKIIDVRPDPAFKDRDEFVF